MNYWMLTPDALQRIEAAISEAREPSAEQLARFDAVDRMSGERLISRAGSSAEITVEGVLTQKPSWMAMIFGGGNTSYQELRAAQQSAEADSEVKEIVYRFNSPGGSTLGLLEAMDVIADSTKPTRGIIEGMAASAAFGLASQVDKLEANHVGSFVGSVGVVSSYYVDGALVDITSTDAPDKRPDASTEAGRAKIREFLDAIHAEFAGAIASGRNVTLDKVNADFGKGAVLLASAALDAGMIDGIVKDRTPTKATTSQERQEQAMDLQTLRADNRNLYDQVVAIGASQEKERVQAHLEMAKIGGEAGMKMALEAIESGAGLDSPLAIAKYHTAAANKGDTSARENEQPDTSGTQETPDATGEKDDVTKAHEAMLNDGGDFVVDPEGAGNE